MISQFKIRKDGLFTNLPQYISIIPASDTCINKFLRKNIFTKKCDFLWIKEQIKHIKNFISSTCRCIVFHRHLLQKLLPNDLLATIIPLLCRNKQSYREYKRRTVSKRVSEFSATASGQAVKIVRKMTVLFKILVTGERASFLRGSLSDFSSRPRRLRKKPRGDRHLLKGDEENVTEGSERRASTEENLCSLDIRSLLFHRGRGQRARISPIRIHRLNPAGASRASFQRVHTGHPG